MLSQKQLIQQIDGEGWSSKRGIPTLYDCMNMHAPGIKGSPTALKSGQMLLLFLGMADDWYPNNIAMNVGKLIIFCLTNSGK